MSYAAIMVHVEPDHPNDARVQIAADLSDRFGATLIGVAAAKPSPPVIAEGYAVDALSDQEEKDVLARLEIARQRFHAAAGENGRRVEWRSAIGFPADVVAREARAADLLITGSNRDFDQAGPYRSFDPGELVLRLGRPMLVVPPQIERLAAKRAVVGWKDTREARRAVLDAMPLLIAAEQVIVVEVAEDAEVADARDRTDDVARYLGRHGVKAVGRVEPDVGSAYDRLSSVAWDEGADLLVTGAYGHSRTREWILGGMTRDLLTRSGLCSLLAH